MFVKRAKARIGHLSGEIVSGTSLKKGPGPLGRHRVPGHLLGALLVFVFVGVAPGAGTLMAAPPPLSSSLSDSPNDLVREGLRFDFGAKGAPRDLSRAIALYRKAAARGRLPAMMLLSQRYEIGRGVPQDDSRALFWLRKAARGGYPPAEDALGDRYAGGVGVKKDDALAVSWYLRAGRHGYGESQDLLGLRYERGEGVPRDLSRARYWYTRAARDAGNPDAFSRLGVLWESGQGGPRNLARAYFWDSLAKTTNPAAQERYEALSKKLSPEVRRRLDREAAEFLRRYRPRWSRFILRP